MNGSMGNMAFGASETPASENVLSLKTVQRMLPLVQRIVDDILRSQQLIDRLQPEQDRLECKKRALDWPERQRRYDLMESLSGALKTQEGACEELHDLGVVLLDHHLGRIGFPTLVNNRRAFFSWQSGEEGLHSWHFAEETVFRPIPPAWLKELTVSSKG